MDEETTESVRVMGSELGQLFQELQDEYEWLWSKWDVFKELFTKGADRIELLNAVAPNFFYVLRQLLYQDAMLHLCRLTDPPDSKQRDQIHQNLTLRRLAEAIPDPALKDDIQKNMDEVLKKCDFAKRWRDKHLAHRDLLVSRHKLSPLPEVTRQDVEDALTSVRNLLDTVAEYYGLRLAALSSDPWGASSLVHYLQRGLQAEGPEG